MKKLIGRWIGTFAAKKVAFQAASAVTAVTLVAAPVVSNVATVYTATKSANTAAVEKVSEGGVEGTKNIDDLLDENGSLKGFVDVSDWTQEDLDKSNEAKQEAKKKAEEEMLANSPDSWENFVKNNPDAVESEAADVTQMPEQTPSAETPDIPADTAEEEEKKGPYDGQYARPGTVGPNGEQVGNIEDMPGYNGDTGKTEEEKWQEKQDELDNRDDNWDKYWENHPEDVVPETSVETPGTSADAAREQEIENSQPDHWEEGDPLPWEAEAASENAAPAENSEE